jgi:hypothetical protein
VRLFVERLRYPISLPNQFSGEPLMVELKGALDVATVASAAADLIDDPADRARRAARLRATMPRPGAAERLVRRVYEDLGWQLPEAPPSTAPLAAGRTVTAPRREAGGLGGRTSGGRRGTRKRGPGALLGALGSRGRGRWGGRP